MFSVTQNGKTLDASKYNWDEKTRTFSTNESNLVLDFSTSSYWSFKTGYGCTLITGSHCTFKTGSDCTFKTGFHCTFDTGYGCTFDTGSHCTFKTSSHCTFDTVSDCTFNTGEKSVVVRRDVFEIIQLVPNQTIKLNGCGVSGYAVIEEKKEVMNQACNGKIVEIDGKKYKLQELT